MQLKMPALVKDGNGLSVKSLPQPFIIEDADVLIRVEIAGLCRTDIYVADGIIARKSPVILGHEFSGTIADAGNACGDMTAGDKVTVNPLFPCHTCSLCSNGQSSNCQDTTFLGVDTDGCFAGFVVVPRNSIHKLPMSASMHHAAYAEPIAASLAVLKTGIRPNQKGLLLGKNRFSNLLEKILRLKKFDNFTVEDNSDAIAANVFDYVIETSIDDSVLATMIRAVRPGGALILKSRKYDPITLNLIDAIKKEPIFHVVNYGSFEEAMNLIASGQLNLDDLIDGVYKLEDYVPVLTKARNSESLKPFFAPWGT